MRLKIKAVVKFTYEPRLEDELGLTKGEYVYVVEKSTDGRWKGEAPNGSVGWFPSNYVKEITPSYDYSPPLSPKQVVASTNTPSYDYSPPRSPEKVEASTNGNQGSIENRNPAAAVPAPIAMQPPPPPAQAKASVPRASLEVVVALYSFDASSSEELSFNKGEQLEIVSHPVHDPDWWQARNTHGTIGLVPRNYIEGIYPSSSLNQDFASPQYSGKETPTEHEPRFVSSTPSKRASEDKASAVIPKKLRRQ